MNEDRLLLVTHVALKIGETGVSIDDQTARGIVRWSDNFERIAYAGIGTVEEAGAQQSSINWVPIADLPCAGRLEVIPMPNAYRVQDFVALYRSGRARLATEVTRSRFLCFTVGALAGDWAAVASLEAIRQKRRYAVWFDRVEHEVVRSGLPGMPLKRRVKESACLPFMQLYHQHLVRRCDLGLFQGKDCYDYYSRFTSVGQCVYDTHTSKKDFIKKSGLDLKVSGIAAGDALRICYVGRAADMKGPIDWLEVLSRLRDAGVPFMARWLGDGPLLDQMRTMVMKRSLDAHVELTGFVSDRAETLDVMKTSHVFMFCHKTPESPRCLIEALVCGAPIVGYRSSYASELTSADGGGTFVDVGDVQGLVNCLIDLHQDRTLLSEQVMRAAQSGRRFDEETVYRHRANLIRSML